MKKYERQYTKPMYLAIQAQINESIKVLRQDGLQGAKRDLFNLDFNGKVYSLVNDMYKTIGVFYANQEYGQLLKQLPKRKGFGFNAQWISDLVNYFRFHLLNVVVNSISDTTKEQIRRVLEQATNEGWGVDQTVRALQDTELTKWRARVIVRTETAKAAFKGRELAREKIDYQTTNEWIAANDHRTRHSHRRVDGDVVEPGKEFKVPVFKGDVQIGFEYMTGPGDPKASKGNVINCRCTSAAMIKFDEKGMPIPKNGVAPVTGQRLFENGGGVKPQVEEKPKPVFVPAKTLKEAAMWAKENLGVRYADFTGLDIGVANDINKAVFNIKNVMPDIRTYGIGSAQAANKAAKEKLMTEYKKSDWYKGNVEKFGQRLADSAADSFVNRHVSRVGNGTIAWSTNNESARIPGGDVVDLKDFVGVFVNQKEGKSKANIDAIVRKNRDNKWFTESANDFGYIMTHEIGHEIDKTIGFRNTKEFIEIYNRENALGVESVKNKLSGYAATAGGRASHKPFEMIAEAWAEFMTSESPRPLAKEIGELMLKKYYEKSVVESGVSFNEWYNQILKIIKQ